MRNIDELLPSAKEILKQAALKEAEKAEEYRRTQAAAEMEKRELIEELTKPSGLSEEEKVKRASAIIQRAVKNGLNEVQVFRFPNVLCTDRGRAINQLENGWEKTLTKNKVNNLEALYKKLHAEIRKNPKRAEKAAKKPVRKVISKEKGTRILTDSKGKKWLRNFRLTRDERRERVQAKIQRALAK